MHVSNAFAIILAAFASCRAEAPDAELATTTPSTGYFIEDEIVEAPKPAPLEALQVEGVKPITRVGKLLLAGQPSEAALATLKADGLTTIVDLRRASEDRGFDEPKLARDLGLNYTAIPFGGSEPLTDAVFDRTRLALDDHRRKGKGDLCLHCAGSVRVGAVWVASRTLDEGVPWATAIAEARQAGLRSKGLEKIAEHYVLGGGNQELGRTKLELRERFKDVPRTTVLELEALTRNPKAKRPLLVDTRAKDEFDVSHLPGAVHATSVEVVKKLIEAHGDSSEVVVYCSVGWRSAELTSKLADAGLKNVKNLEGSIFEWANRGFPVLRDGTPVREVHPYDAKWGKLLRAELHPKR